VAAKIGSHLSWEGLRGCARGNWGARGMLSSTGLKILPTPPVGCLGLNRAGGIPPPYKETVVRGRGVRRLTRSEWDIVANLMSNVLLIVLALDLVYLYFAGQWYDPLSWVETIELVVLGLILIYSIYCILRLRSSLRRKG